MTHQEEYRINTFKKNIENGKRIFNQLLNYFHKEEVLNTEDIAYYKDEIIIKLIYLNRPYLLELTYNENLKLGQVLVYETETGTHFLPEPKFKLKATSEIYFDEPGNIFIGNSTSAVPVPSKAAELIILEVCK
ncbi:hypothetical protein [Polaribacter sp. Asnod6-C07]|uniref:hypothetical protein n=1 Tax=Polaribacter sp. Asnod6-C07 TaxID=3160582 RepID=UPI003865727D